MHIYVYALTRGHKGAEVNLSTMQYLQIINSCNEKQGKPVRLFIDLHLFNSLANFASCHEARSTLSHWQKFELCKNGSTRCRW